MKDFKKNFITGLVAVLPITLTLYIIIFLISKIGGIVGKYLQYIKFLSFLPSFVHSLIGFVIIFFLIYIVGMITSGYIGKFILRLSNNILNRLPLFKSVYSAAQKMINTIFIDKSAFRKVIIIPYPKEGSFAVSFMTSEKSIFINGEEYINAFVPTVPNPTSGFYLLIRKRDVVETDLSIEEGFKVIFSAGVINLELKNNV